jgi:hypothetical protein
VAGTGCRCTGRWPVSPRRYRSACQASHTVLARRTGVREFDFDLDGERHAMGELLGQLSERSFGQARLLISVLVQYLNANDAGPGFYELAQRKKLLGPHPSQDDKLVFWVRHVQAVHAQAW